MKFPFSREKFPFTVKISGLSSINFTNFHRKVFKLSQNFSFTKHFKLFSSIDAIAFFFIAFFRLQSLYPRTRLNKYELNHFFTISLSTLRIFLSFSRPLWISNWKGWKRQPNNKPWTLTTNVSRQRYQVLVWLLELNVAARFQTFFHLYWNLNFV